MQAFTRLFEQLERTTRTSEKVAAMELYFAAAPPADAAWALYFLSGRRVLRAVSSPKMRDWAAAEAGIPVWLLHECYDAVGDLGETLALILPERSEGTTLPLHRLIEDRLLPMRRMDDAAERAVLVQTWRELTAMQRLVWHKLIGGEFRIGASARLAANALARVANTDPAVMAHRLMGNWKPTPEDYARILRGDSAESDPGQPYPFYLASPLEAEPATLGPIEGWQAEWKWDGIRAQVIRRHGQVLIWSRGEELMTDRFPEIAQAAALLPDGTVIDGELLAWENEKPLHFGQLQRRIGRKREEMRLWDEVPLAFVAYDLLEAEGVDLRDQPLSERRARLEALLAPLVAAEPIRLSPIIRANSWEELAQLQQSARERMVEGIMLKRRDSPYGVGRTRGDWWKWKIDPYVIDAVLINAQPGHGRRASLYTDYTFGLWDNGELVPVAKAYSGLTDEEIREVDAFVRKHTVERFGPVRAVKPELVFELAFEGVQESNRHRAGVAVRFPRMNRWRKDKKPAEADTLDALRKLRNVPSSVAAAVPAALQDLSDSDKTQSR